MELSAVTKGKVTFYGLTIIFLFSLFYCYDYLLQISISVFLPTIKSSFHLNDFQLGLIGSTFFLTYVAMQIPGGYLIDQYGPWKIALGMSFLCGVGALLMYFSVYSYTLLILSRLFIGLGSSIAFICAINIISLHAPMRQFSLFIGVLQALAGIGAICGQAPIAYLNLFLPWNQIAFLFFLMALLFLVCFLILMRDQNRDVLEETRIAPTKVTWKQISAVLKDKVLFRISLLSFISWSPVASLAGFWLVQYLYEVDKLSTIQTGTMITTFWLGMIIGSILIPVLSEALRKRKPILVGGFLLQIVAVVIIIVVPKIYYLLISAFFMLGFISPIQGFCIVLARDVKSQEGFGIISGLVNMFGAVSGGVMQFVIGFLLAYVFSGFANPYRWSFMVYLLLALIGLYISLISYKESHPLKTLLTNK